MAESLHSLPKTGGGDASVIIICSGSLSSGTERFRQVSRDLNAATRMSVSVICY